MLPKKHRISVPVFNKLPIKGNNLTSVLGHVVVKENNLGVPRIAMVVSKRLDKRSVVRNRIKRIISNSLYDIVLNTLKGADILIKVKPIVATFDYQTIKKELEKIFKKL